MLAAASLLLPILSTVKFVSFLPSLNLPFLPSSLPSLPSLLSPFPLLTFPCFPPLFLSPPHLPFLPPLTLPFHLLSLYLFLPSPSPRSTLYLPFLPSSPSLYSFSLPVLSCPL